MWGKHLIVDMSEGDRERVGSAEHIRRFVEDLRAIGIQASAAPVLQHFAGHAAAGYALVQLVETSAITGRFCDSSGDAYIDIFSCKDFDTDRALEVIKRGFQPQRMKYMTLAREAPQAPSIAAE